MSGEIVGFDQRNTAPVSVQDTLQTMRIIQQVMQSVMKQDVHYGVIPGCKQPSLYKAGSEVLLSTFRIAVEPRIEEFVSRDERGRVTEIRYRVHCTGRHMSTGVEIGIGVGECSTGEDKYAWRRAVCLEEFDATDETSRRIKWKKYNNKVDKDLQVRTCPADLSNTVLKMAKKRAQIDLTLTSLGCSDIFAQDLEDLDETIRDSFADVPKPGSAELLKKWVDLANAAANGEVLKKVWSEGLKEIKAAQDMPAYKALKAAVEAKDKELKQAEAKSERPVTAETKAQTTEPSQPEIPAAKSPMQEFEDMADDIPY